MVHSLINYQTSLPIIKKKKKKSNIKNHFNYQIMEKKITSIEISEHSILQIFYQHYKYTTLT